MVRKFAKLGEIIFGEKDDELVSVALGSCVAVVLYSPERKLSIMAHIVLPHKNGFKRAKDDIGRYADTAIPYMITKMQQRGIRKSDLKAKVAGGSKMYQLTKASHKKYDFKIGERNGEAIIQILQENGIELVSKDLGGDYAKTVKYEVHTGALIITSSFNQLMRIL